MFVFIMSLLLVHYHHHLNWKRISFNWHIIWQQTIENTHTFTTKCDNKIWHLADLIGSIHVLCFVFPQNKASDIWVKFKVCFFLTKSVFCNFLNFLLMGQPEMHKKTPPMSFCFKGSLIIHLALMSPAKHFLMQASALLPAKMASLFLCCLQCLVSLDFIFSGGPCHSCMENCFVATR